MSKRRRTPQYRESRKLDNVRTTRIDDVLAKRLTAAMKRGRRSESAILRRALEKYLDEIELGDRTTEEMEAA